MENRERYKRLIMFSASALIVAIETLLFAYIWYRFYAHKNVIGRRFDRGNQVVIGLYVLMMYFFYKIYGGFKVGYLRVFEVIYSQILSVVCVNFITYLQLCLIGRWRLGEHLSPMLAMTGIDLVIVVVWVVGMRFVYTRLYPPRQMLMIYGGRNPVDLRDKLETREDKYAIKEMAPLSLGLDALVEVHDEEEMERALKLDARIIGVNNRNLKDFTISLDNTKRLRGMAGADKIFVAESGIVTDDDVLTLKEYQVDAFLIGRAFMEADNPKELAKHWKAL